MKWTAGHDDLALRRLRPPDLRGAQVYLGAPAGGGPEEARRLTAGSALSGQALGSAREAHGPAGAGARRPRARRGRAPTATRGSALAPSPTGRRPVAASVGRAAPPRRPPSSRTGTEPHQARKQTRALFFGDSYIIGGAYTGPQNSMAAIAARRLGWRLRDPRRRRHRVRLRQPRVRHPVVPRPDPAGCARRRRRRLAGHRGRRQRQVRRAGGHQATRGPRAQGRGRSGTPRPGWCWSAPWTRPSTASATPTG